MKRLLNLGLFVIFFTTIIFAQDKISLNGVVTDEDGDAVKGAIVTLLGKDFKDTTDKKGKYSIKYEVSDISLSQQILKNPVFQISSNRIIFSQNKTQQITLDLFNFKGKRVKRLFNGTLNKGKHTFSIPNQSIANQIYMLRIISGQNVTLHKINNLLKGTKRSIESVDKNINGIASHSFIKDTLTVEHDDYEFAQKQIKKYIKTVNFSLTLKKYPPETPEGLIAEGISSSEMKVSFEPVSEALGYYVYFKTDNTEPFTILDTLTDQTSNIYKGLDPETEYFYKVSAYNDDGESEKSKYVSAMTKKKIQTPQNCVATGMSSKEIKIEFTAVTGANSYKLYNKKSPSDPFTVLDSFTTSTYTHSNLTKATEYFYKISACDGNGGESELSQEFSAKTYKIVGVSTCTRWCGRCGNSCAIGALTKVNGKAYIDPEKCDGCGECIKVCNRLNLKEIPSFILKIVKDTIAKVFN